MLTNNVKIALGVQKTTGFQRKVGQNSRRSFTKLFDRWIFANKDRRILVIQLRFSKDTINVLKK